MTENNIEGQGVKRRSVVKAAAWAAPVVAVAAAAPMAAASAEQAFVQSFGSGTASPTNVATGGSLGVGFSNSGMQIRGITGAPWSAGVFTAELSIVENFTPTAVSINGNPVTSTGGSFTSATGQVWTVTAIDLANNVLVLKTTDPITVDVANGPSQQFTIPTIDFTGTYTGSVKNSGRVILDVSAASVSGAALPGVRFGA